MSEASNRRSQSERRAASEAALLRSAAELIAEQGPDGATMRNIGARAGASRAMPGYHFGSKDELVAQLSKQANERTWTAVATAIRRVHGDLSTMPVLTALRIITETYLEVVAGSDAAEERAVVVLWGASFPTESPLVAVRESDAENHRLLVQLVRQGQADGSVRGDVAAEVAASMVMGMVRGVAGLSLTHPALADTADVRSLCGAAVVAALLPRSSDALQADVADSA